MSETGNCWICWDDGEVKTGPPVSLCQTNNGRTLLRQGCQCSSYECVHVECLVKFCAKNSHKWQNWSNCTICQKPFIGALQVIMARVHVMFTIDKNLAKDEEEYLNAKENLAVALLMVSREYAEALEILEEVFAIKKKKWGNGADVTLRTMAAIASIHRSMGNFELALRKYKETLAVLRNKTNGEKTDYYFVILNSLAEVHIQRGEFEDALPLAKESLDGYRQAQGGENINTFVSLFLLGLLHWHMAYSRGEGLTSQECCDVAKLERSAELLEEAAEGLLKTLGEENDDARYSMCWSIFVNNSLRNLRDATLENRAETHEQSAGEVDDDSSYPDD